MHWDLLYGVLYSISGKCGKLARRFNNCIPSRGTLMHMHSGCTPYVSVASVRSLRRSISPYTYHQHCSNPLYGVRGHCWIMALRPLEIAHLLRTCTTPVSLPRFRPHDLIFVSRLSGRITWINIERGTTIVNGLGRG
jgi:hypothetical protein